MMNFCESYDKAHQVEAYLSEVPTWVLIFLAISTKMKKNCNQMLHLIHRLLIQML